MIIRMGRPFANYHPNFFLSTRFFSILLFIFSKLLIIPPTNTISPFKIFLLLLHLQILRSRFNLEDLSRTMCSCFFSFCFVFSVHKSKTFWNCIEAGVHRCILGSPPPPHRISSTSASTNIGSLTALAWIHMHLK